MLEKRVEDNSIAFFEIQIGEGLRCARGNLQLGEEVLAFPFSVFIIRENFLELTLVARTQETIPFYTAEIISTQ